MNATANPSSKRRSPRGAVHQAGSKLITTWVPTGLDDLMTQAINRLDLDRSKFVRRAIRNELGRCGVSAPSPTK